MVLELELVERILLASSPESLKLGNFFSRRTITAFADDMELLPSIPEIANPEDPITAASLFYDTAGIVKRVRADRQLTVRLVYETPYAKTDLILLRPLLPWPLYKIGNSFVLEVQVSE